MGDEKVRAPNILASDRSIGRLRASAEPVKNCPVCISEMIMVDFTPQENPICISLKKVERNDFIAALLRRERRPISGGAAGMIAGTNEKAWTAELVGHGEKI